MATFKAEFPKNPTDGMVFEPIPNVIWIYKAAINSWIRVESQDVDPATPLKSGLMEAKDLKKLNTLLIPPPQTTISTESSDTKFSSGIIDLYSNDKSVLITTSPKSKDGNDIVSTPWAIHENTAGIGFELNLDKFVQEIERLSKVTKIQIAGDQGPQGPIGDDGIDRLDTGPEGAKGPAGANAAFPGSVISETIQFEVEDEQNFRAVVDIGTEKTSDGNYLVLTRANIGNPTACPSEIRPKDLETNWLLVIDESEGKVERKIEKTASGDLVCRICTSKLYYLNIEDIINAVKERFLTKINEVKEEKEGIVRDWLGTMAAVFTEQKYALCCALNNCISRKRNTSDRRYIEGQQIQASHADQRLIIDSNEDHRVVSPTNEVCDVEVEDDTLHGGNDSHVVYGVECNEPLATIRLDARLHTSDPRNGGQKRWVNAVLPEGDYVLEVLDCCANISKRPKPEPLPAAPPKPQRPGGPFIPFSSSTGLPSGQRVVSGTLIDTDQGRPIKTLCGTVFLNDPNVPLTPEVIQAIRDDCSDKLRLGDAYNAAAASVKLGKVFDDAFARARGWVPEEERRGAWNAQQQAREGDKFIGRVALAYRSNQPTTQSTTTQIVEQVVEVPDLGTYEDPAQARHKYIGITAAFRHAGGEVRLWIPDPDRLPTNNEGQIVVGIKSRKCVEEQTVEATGAGPEIKNLYVYRGTISLDTLIAKIAPYETETTHFENYGYDGQSANIVVGPTQEANRTKVFFVRASDGLGFYMVHSKKDAPIVTDVSLKMIVEGSTDLSVLSTDEVGNVVKTEIEDQQIFTANWEIENDADGVVLGALPDDEDETWIIELDNMDFGGISRLSAAGLLGDTSEEFILAQGENDEAIPPQDTPEPFLLCRALRRSCNVPEGFGGRYSLGVINRVQGKSFRICRNLPEWSLRSYIQPEYTYAPYPEPCGATLCDVKYEKAVGSDPCDILPRVNGDYIDILYIVDHSGSMSGEIDSIPGFIEDFDKFLKTDNGFGKQPQRIRYSLVTFGGPEGQPGTKAAPKNPKIQGDPKFQIDWTTDVTQISGKVDQIRTLVGPKEPALWATQFAVNKVEWGLSSVRLAILISNEGADKRKGITRLTVDKALKDNDVIFNVITRLNRRDKKEKPTGVASVLAPLAEANNGAAFEIDELVNEPALGDHTNWVYDQPFKYIRTGLDLSIGGGNNAFNGSGLEEEYIFGGVPNYYTIQGFVRGPDDFFKGALVHLRSNRTGDKVIATSITDTSGAYQFRIPANFFPPAGGKETIFTITTDLYAPQPYQNWSIDNIKHTGSKRKQRLYVSGGGVSPIGVEDVLWTQGDGDDEFEFSNSLVTIRGASDLAVQNQANPALGSDGFYPAAFQRIDDFRVIKIGKENRIAFNIKFSNKENPIDFDDLNVRFTHPTVPCGNERGDIPVLVTKSTKFTLQAATGRQELGFSTVDLIFDTIQEITDLTSTVNECRFTFMDRFKDQKFKEIFTPRDCTDNEANIFINGGPASTYKHVSPIAMDANTLTGKVVSVIATIQGVPSLSIRPVLYDIYGRGMVLNSKQMPPQTVWNTQSWKTSDVDRYISASNAQLNPPGNEVEYAPFDIVLQELVNVGFEFINPPTGRIAFFGEVKVAVEREIAGIREIVLVEIANFEPFKSSRNDPGEIPLVIWDRDPSEEDFSNYLECFWTIAEAGSSTFQPMCTRLKEYCPDCSVVNLTVPTDTGDTAVIQEIDCRDKPGVVPLNNYILTPLAPGDSCLMYYKQVEWYERGWRIGACCGAMVELNGVQWLIVKRSIGVDTSCGGGESANTKCISQFVERGEGHPAIAWPTIDGEEFAGAPTSGFVRFVTDKVLSNELIGKVSSNEFVRLKGNLTSSNVTDTIPFILFPALD